MSYSKARWNAAHCLSHTTGGKIRANADEERRFYMAVAEHGGYGYGARTPWTFKTPATVRRLAERLIAKGLLVDASEGFRVRYELAPEPQAEFDRMVAVLERQEAEERAAEEAEKQAAFAAQQAVEAQRKWAVMAAGTVRTYGTLHGKVHQQVFTGETGKADAEAYAAELRSVGNNVTMVFEITEDVHA